MNAILQPCSAPQLLLQCGRPQYDARAQESAAQHMAHPRGDGGEQVPPRTRRTRGTSPFGTLSTPPRHPRDALRTDSAPSAGGGSSGAAATEAPRVAPKAAPPLKAEDTAPAPAPAAPSPSVPVALQDKLLYELD